ncbi:MAG TPA: cytochrome P450 [Solirubrobacteraceae bacterium]|jgi:cytochrome P450
MTAARSIRDLPGPRGLPLIGNAHQMFPPTRVHLKAEAWARRYGPIARIRIGRRELIGIADAEAVNEILRDRPDGFRRWREQEMVFREMGASGVFTAEGTEWKRQRRLVVTALNTNHIHRYYEIVRTCTERLYARLREAAASGAVLHITDELTSFTVDTTSWLALGHDLNTLQRGDDELQGHIRRVMRMSAHRLAMPYPYWRRIRLPADRKLDRATRAMRDAIHGFIAQARARMDASPGAYEEPRNLLEGMLAAQHADGSFTDDEIVGNVFVILLAGEDTTAHTLAWTLWLLGPRPDIQRQIAEEATAALGQDTVPRDYETAENLPYTDAVLQESMRLRSVTGALPLEPIHDVTICDTHIPADTRLVLLMRYVCRAAAGATNEFLPERWIEDNESTRPTKHLSFGAGPRFCPGRNVAMLESKAVLAMIARNFDVQLDESRGPVTERWEFSIVPRGLRLRLQERVPDAVPTAAASTE